MESLKENQKLQLADGSWIQTTEGDSIQENLAETYYIHQFKYNKNMREYDEKYHSMFVSGNYHINPNLRIRKLSDLRSYLVSEFDIPRDRVAHSVYKRPFCVLSISKKGRWMLIFSYYKVGYRQADKDTLTKWETGELSELQFNSPELFFTLGSSSKFDEIPADKKDGPKLAKLLNATFISK